MKTLKIVLTDCIGADGKRIDLIGVEYTDKDKDICEQNYSIYDKTCHFMDYVVPFLKVCEYNTYIDDAVYYVNDGTIIVVSENKMDDLSDDIINVFKSLNINITIERYKCGGIIC